MRRHQLKAIAVAARRKQASRPALFGLLAGLALLLLTACGGAAATATPAEAPDAGATAGTSPIDLALPDITIAAYQGADHLGGDSVLLSDLLTDGTPVVLNFWAALCPPCRAEMPDFQEIHDTRAHEVTIVGVDIGPQQLLGTRDQGRQLLQELGITYPAGTTFDDNVLRGFEILGMPTTFFIDTDGSVLRSWSGLLTAEKINEFIDQLVAA